MNFNFKLQGWQRRAAYGAFALAAFLFALRQTVPTEAVKERLVMEAAAALAAHAGPGALAIAVLGLD